MSTLRNLTFEFIFPLQKIFYAGKIQTDNHPQISRERKINKVTFISRYISYMHQQYMFTSVDTQTQQRQQAYYDCQYLHLPRHAYDYWITTCHNTLHTHWAFHTYELNLNFRRKGRLGRHRISGKRLLGRFTVEKAEEGQNSFHRPSAANPGEVVRETEVPERSGQDGIGSQTGSDRHASEDVVPEQKVSDIQINIYRTQVLNYSTGGDVGAAPLGQFG